jgi:hypothetical protein
MNPLGEEWSIQHRSETCAVTGRAFEPGETFYTLLFREGGGFRRQDLSEEAWKERNDNLQPFSFWRSRFEPPPAAPPEPLAKENAEELFRLPDGTRKFGIRISKFRTTLKSESRRMSEPRQIACDYGYSGGA